MFLAQCGHDLFTDLERKVRAKGSHEYVCHLPLEMIEGNDKFRFIENKRALRIVSPSMRYLHHILLYIQCNNAYHAN